MLRTGLLASISVCIVAMAVSASLAEEAEPTRLRGLLVTGGCCHDYDRQKLIITEGLSQRVSISWKIVHEGGTSRDHKVSIYQTPDWSKGYDVVVHNECFGAVEDAEFVERIVSGHAEAGVPAVVIHCSMHSYRNAPTEEWRKLLGVTSRRHEKGGRRLDVRPLTPHPVMKGFPDKWKTPNGELYVIENVWPRCTALAVAYGEDTEREHPVVWLNQHGKARVFGTTLGHHNETMLDEVWLDMLARGVLWTVERLEDDGSPASGFAGSGKAPFSFEQQKSGSPTPAKRQP